MIELSSTGINVTIYPSNGKLFSIEKIPNTASVTYNLNGNGYDSFTSVQNSKSISGTIIKTGKKSFTFNVLMESLNTSETNLVATGKGNY